MYESILAQLQIDHENAIRSADGIKEAEQLTRASNNLMSAYMIRHDMQLKYIETLEAKLNKPLWKRILNI